MTPCSRSCCWVPMAGVCARNRSCACHWDERNGYAPTLKGGADATYNDPTSREAIRNVMNQERRPR